jgi:hypothetical protein
VPVCRLQNPLNKTDGPPAGVCASACVVVLLLLLGRWAMLMQCVFALCALAHTGHVDPYANLGADAGTEESHPPAADHAEGI